MPTSTAKHASKPRTHRKTKRIGIVIAAVLVVFCAASIAFDRYVLDQTYARFPGFEGSLLPTYEDYAEQYPRQDVSFELDGQTLRGHVYGAENTRGLIIFRHGIFSQHQDYLPMITAMVDRGWKVFAYDAIGCGESDGDDVLGMSQSPHDVEAAVAFARESGMADDMAIGLWGHSWGGYGVAGALGHDVNVNACVTMSGFDTPIGVLTATAEGQFGPVALTQEPFLRLLTWLDFGDGYNASASQAIIESGTPTLVIHGTEDATVSYDKASIYSALQRNDSVENVTFIAMDTEGRNDHNDYFYAPDSQQYFDQCTEELSSLLEENDGDETAPEVVAYIDGVDIIAANTADPALINQIDAFFAEHLED